MLEPDIQFSCKQGSVVWNRRGLLKWTTPASASAMVPRNRIYDKALITAHTAAHTLHHGARNMLYQGYPTWISWFYKLYIRKYVRCSWHQYHERNTGSQWSTSRAQGVDAPWCGEDASAFGKKMPLLGTCCPLWTFETLPWSKTLLRTRFGSKHSHRAKHSYSKFWPCIVYLRAWTLRDSIVIYTRYGWDRSCRRVQFWFPIS